jgi:hypothetical protein
MNKYNCTATPPIRVHGAHRDSFTSLYFTSLHFTSPSGYTSAEPTAHSHRSQTSTAPLRATPITTAPLRATPITTDNCVSTRHANLCTSVINRCSPPFVHLSYQPLLSSICVPQLSTAALLHLCTSVINRCSPPFVYLSYQPLLYGALDSGCLYQPVRNQNLKTSNSNFFVKFCIRKSKRGFLHVT